MQFRKILLQYSVVTYTFERKFPRSDIRNLCGLSIRKRRIPGHGVCLRKPRKKKDNAEPKPILYILYKYPSGLTPTIILLFGLRSVVGLINPCPRTTINRAVSSDARTWSGALAGPEGFSQSRARRVGLRNSWQLKMARVGARMEERVCAGD